MKVNYALIQSITATNQGLHGQLCIESTQYKDFTTLTLRTILYEDDDGRDDVTGSGSCPLVAAGLWILSTRRRAQLWILPAGGGWAVDLA